MSSKIKAALAMANTRGKDEEHVAPAEQIAEHATAGLAEQLSQDLSGKIGTDHLLPALVRDDVADIGKRQRDDPAGREPRDIAARSPEPAGTVQARRSPPGPRESAQAKAMLRYFPNLSPTGPMMSWTEPWVNE